MKNMKKFVGVFFVVALALIAGGCSKSPVASNAEKISAGVYYCSQTSPTGARESGITLIFDGTNLRVGSSWTSTFSGVNSFKVVGDSIFAVLACVNGDSFDIGAKRIPLTEGDYEKRDVAHPFRGLYETHTGTEYLIAMRDDSVKIVNLDCYFDATCRGLQSETKNLSVSPANDSVNIDGFGCITTDSQNSGGILFWKKPLDQTALLGLDRY
jgi:hypothetical protein